MNTRRLLSTTLAISACSLVATAQAPANDNCANATVIVAGSNPFDSTGATTDGLDILAGMVCDFGSFAADGQVYQDVWFDFTPATTELFDIEVVNNGLGEYDTRIAIYNQSTCPDDPALVLGCDDDGGTGLLSLINDVSLMAGTTYKVRVGTFAATTAINGADLAITPNGPPPSPPANDDCVSAAVAMVGLTAMDSRAATDGAGLALDDLVCGFSAGDDQIYQDVWYSFTPSATDVYSVGVVSNGNPTWDSRVAVYNQSTCPDDPALVIGCDDDSGPNTEALATGIAMTAGSTYLIRAGSFSATTTEDLAALSIEGSPVPLLNPVNGNHYMSFDTSGISWTDAKAAAEAMTHMGVQGHLAVLTDQSENDFIYANFDNVHYHWIGGFQDTMDPMYSEPTGGWKWITGEPFVYTNWLAGEPNNTGANGAEDFLELLDTVALGETWNDADEFAHPAGYVVEFPTGTGGQTGICHGDGGNGMGCSDCPCGNNAAPGTTGGCLNSSGNSTALASSGSTSVSLPSGDTTDLRFTLTGAPPSATCVLISGNAVAPQNMASPCFGLDSGALAADRDGLRCAVQSTIRHGNRSANAMGEIMDPTGPNRVWGGEAQPVDGLAVQGGFISGQTRFFQVTHRDDALAVCMRGLNTSQAIGVTFTP